MQGSKTVSVKDNHVVMNYTHNFVGQTGMPLKKLVVLVSTFSMSGIFPRVIEFGETKNGISVKVEKVKPCFDEDGNEINKEIVEWCLKNNLNMRKEMEKSLNIQVYRLHQIGYCHGDLHHNNIGFKIIDNKLIFLLDMDTVFLIDTGKNNPKVMDWIKNNFDKMTYEEFVEYDYTNALCNI